VGDIDFKVISATENSNNFPKNTRFWKGKSIEDVVTLGPTAQATLVVMKLSRRTIKITKKKKKNPHVSCKHIERVEG
jgi:hypothetical protein